MHIVVIDRDALPGEVDFPALSVNRYGWEEYRALGPEEIAERCWRADVVVTFGTAIEPRILERLARLKLVVAAGAGENLVDLKTAEAQGVAVSHVDADITDPAERAAEVVAIIEAFLRGERRSAVAMTA